MSIYLTYIYRALFNGKLCRWNKRVVNVYINYSWVGPYKDLQDLESRIKSAFQQWENALAGKLVFNYVETSKECDIYIDFQRNSCIGAIGQCKFVDIDKDGNFKKMYITLGLIWSQNFNQTVVHEIGHAIGIAGHSPSNVDLMYESKNSVVYLSRADINTIRLIYSLPVGCDIKFIQANIEKIVSGDLIKELQNSEQETVINLENMLPVLSKENRNLEIEILQMAVFNVYKLAQNTVEFASEDREFFQEVYLKTKYKK